MDDQPVKHPLDEEVAKIVARNLNEAQRFGGMLHTGRPKDTFNPDLRRLIDAVRREMRFSLLWGVAVGYALAMATCGVVLQELPPLVFAFVLGSAAIIAALCRYEYWKQRKDL
jgi:hypothetical protein